MEESFSELLLLLLKIYIFTSAQIFILALFLSILQDDCIAESRASIPSGFHVLAVPPLQGTHWFIGAAAFLPHHVSLLPGVLPIVSWPGSSFLPALWLSPPAQLSLRKAPLLGRHSNLMTDFRKELKSHVFPSVYLGTLVLRSASG